ncbi:MAG: amino acid adenylation domain-containing protein, partial [Caldilineaceae bacterium]|nr:amino acid adenylation domain-containing protein [Caldilineaceae bacterium]
GILKAGAAYVPLDPAYPSERLRWMVADARPRLLLAEREAQELFADFDGNLLCLDRDDAGVYDEPTSPLPADLQPNQLAYVIYTSGSTGRPKGVELTHRSVVNFLTSMKERPGLTAQDRLLSVTTLSFDIAVLELFLPLITGAELLLASREMAADGIRLREAIEDYQPTVMQATPVTWQLLVASGWNGDKELKVLCGGEALSRDLADQLLTRCGELWNLYGPTECTIWSTLHRVDSDDKQPPIGKPIANTQVYILDRSLRRSPIGVPGELYIGGAGLALGYLNQPELTAARFVEVQIAPEEGTTSSGRLYRTGDLARYRPDGAIEYLGRTDQQVKIRGHRIEPAEIETALARHPSVREAVVVAREDSPGDKVLVAYIVFRAQQMISSAELREALRGHLPLFMIPTEFVPLEAFPLTPNGKVDRRALPAANASRSALLPEFEPPATEIEIQLALIWCELLQKEQVGRYDDIFDLGGHSLMLTRLAARIQERLGVRVALVDLFDHSTIEGMAGLIQAQPQEHANDKYVDEVLEDLAALSDEEIAQLLAS